MEIRIDLEGLTEEEFNNLEYNVRTYIIDRIRNIRIIRTIVSEISIDFNSLPYVIKFDPNIMMCDPSITILPKQAIDDRTIDKKNEEILSEQFREIKKVINNNILETKGRIIKYE